MRKLVLFLLVYTCSFHGPIPPCSGAKALVRQKRGVLDLAVTLWCYRNRLKVPLLGINLYGCYCGTGGSGTAVDDVDRCCLQHDCCYRYSRIELQCHSKIKWQLYNFSCGRSHTECKSTTLCGRMACECDRQFAECLTKAKPKKKHFFYSKGERCRGDHDSCPQMHPDLIAISHQNLTSTDIDTERWIETAKSRRKRWMKKSNKKRKQKDIRASPLWI